MGADCCVANFVHCRGEVHPLLIERVRRVLNDDSVRDIHRALRADLRIDAQYCCREFVPTVSEARMEWARHVNQTFPAKPGNISS